MSSCSSKDIPIVETEKAISVFSTKYKKCFDSGMDGCIDSVELEGVERDHVLTAGRSVGVLFDETHKGVNFTNKYAFYLVEVPKSQSSTLFFIKGIGGFSGGDIRVWGPVGASSK